MKKLFFSLLVIMTCAVNAQDIYWTNYQVVVAPDDNGQPGQMVWVYFVRHDHLPPRRMFELA